MFCIELGSSSGASDNIHIGNHGFPLCHCMYKIFIHEVTLEGSYFTYHEIWCLEHSGLFSIHFIRKKYIKKRNHIQILSLACGNILGDFTYCTVLAQNRLFL